MKLSTFRLAISSLGVLLAIEFNAAAQGPVYDTASVRREQDRPEYCLGAAVLSDTLVKMVVVQDSAKLGEVHVTLFISDEGKVVSKQITKALCPRNDAEAWRVASLITCFTKPGPTALRNGVATYILEVPFDTYSFRKDDNFVYAVVDQNPTFPGGEEGLANYLSKNMRYPKGAYNSKIEGTVNVSFVINTNGTLNNISAPKGKRLGYGLEAEALRLVKAMPDWKPAMQNGKPVKVIYELPVVFMLKH
jgi:TonB family protein